MKAIVARYLPATNSKGARIKVDAAGCKSKTYSYYLDDAQDPQLHAVKRFCELYNWTNKLARGVLPNNDHVFVLIDERENLL